MLHPARLATALMVLLLTLGARWATDPVAPSPPEDPATGSSAAARHNAEVTAGLTERWVALPQVVEAHAGYRGDDAWGAVQAHAVCDRCNRRNLLSRLVRDIWYSDLEHVTSFEVRVAQEDGRADPLVERWDPTRDAQKLYDRYGNGLVDPDEAAAD